jgi:hypothetical protein
MCKCTPEIRTPYCGKPGCEWPSKVVKKCASCVFFEELFTNNKIPVGRGCIIKSNGEEVFSEPEAQCHMWLGEK